MKVVETIAACRSAVAEARSGGARVGFVPTMGALHAGHAALIHAAAQGCDFVVVSIFVNPLQFGPREDYARYPRSLPADVELCAANGAHLVFAPSVAEMYPEPAATFVTVEGLTEGLCGRSRPGHFRGVATVVTKLFNIVQPDDAYFGEKDAQQLAVIRRMVRDLNQPVRVIGVPTVREADGLALSSRNAYLSPEERKAAPVLYRALQEAQAQLMAGERDAAALRGRMLDVIAREPLARVDYAEVVDAETLLPVAAIERPALAALAVYFGQTRLIDNVRLTPPGADS